MEALLKGLQIQPNEMVRVGNLGSFSMKAIYDALSSTRNTSGNSSVTRREKVDQDDEANDSDCSWTMEEENGDFYVQIRRRMDEFSLSPSETTMTTDILSRHQRRFVHGTAQVMNLGHASLGPPNNKQRRMVIYKTQPGLHCIPEIRQDPQSRGISWGCFEELESPSIVSSTASQRKRKRLERLNGGYPCQYAPCSKIFDRASERNKHEQAHQPAFTNRHLCTLCNKGFRYPKDLRRHMFRLHENAASQPIFDPTYASFGSMTVSSALTYESRIPSETSLTFNSNPTSKDNSPLLVGQSEVAGEQAAIEPLALEAGTGLVPDIYLDELSLPFQELADFDFDSHDLCEDEGFLEMARARK